MRLDMTAAAAARRKRTRRLIELGGLVEASGLTDRVGNNPETVMGALRVLVTMMDKAGTGDAGFSSTVLLRRWREAGRDLVADHERALEALKRKERGWAGSASPTRQA